MHCILEIYKEVDLKTSLYTYTKMLTVCDDGYVDLYDCSNSFTVFTNIKCHIHFKYIQFLFVNHTLIKHGKTRILYPEKIFLIKVQ